jgi:hypothetical protein
VLVLLLLLLLVPKHSSSYAAPASLCLVLIDLRAADFTN